MNEEQAGLIERLRAEALWQARRGSEETYALLNEAADALAASEADARRYRLIRSWAGRTNDFPETPEPTSPEHFDEIVDNLKEPPCEK